MKIDPNLRAPNVSVVADVLTIDEFDLDGIAEALADDLKAAIAAQPGGAWNRTGTLLRSVRANGSDVVISGDRLERDPELATKLAAEVMPANPLASASVRTAEERAITDSITKDKR